MRLEKGNAKSKRFWTFCWFPEKVRGRRLTYTGACLACVFLCFIKNTYIWISTMWKGTVNSPFHCRKITTLLGHNGLVQKSVRKICKTYYLLGNAFFTFLCFLIMRKLLEPLLYEKGFHALRLEKRNAKRKMSRTSSWSPENVRGRRLKCTDACLVCVSLCFIKKSYIWITYDVKRYGQLSISLQKNRNRFGTQRVGAAIR